MSASLCLRPQSSRIWMVTRAGITAKTVHAKLAYQMECWQRWVLSVTVLPQISNWKSISINWKKWLSPIERHSDRECIFREEDEREGEGGREREKERRHCLFMLAPWPSLHPISCAAISVSSFLTNAKKWQQSAGDAFRLLDLNGTHIPQFMIWNEKSTCRLFGTGNEMGMHAGCSRLFKWPILVSGIYAGPF